jgi:hypothetical protein
MAKDCDKISEIFFWDLELKQKGSLMALKLFFEK